MCGIVGIVSKSVGGLYYSDLDLFEEMLVCDSLRGLDSTGVFGVYKNKQARMLKVAAEPHSLFRCDEWGEFRTKAISSMTTLVGHNRSATRGAVNSTNAHPFSEGKIVLVHNGTLHNQKDFNKDVEVDSHAIAHALNEKPAKEVLKDVNGAFAFVWYDREEQKLFIARNSERPLAFVETSGAVYFASEGPMLNWILNRKSGPKVDDAEMFPVGKLISFDGKGNREEEDFELYSPPKSTWGGTTARVIGTTVRTLPALVTVPAGTTGVVEPAGRIKSGTKALVEISGFEVRANVTKFTGKLLYPQAGVDCTGFFDRSLTQDEIGQVFKLPYAEGIVQAYHSSNCGPSYFVKDLTFPETVRVYNTSITAAVWNSVVDHCACDKCGKSISSHQPEFTSVKQRGKSNNYRVVCPDCVCEALNDATEHNLAIIEDCNISLQERQPLSLLPEDYPFREDPQTCPLH
jgi:hypothetical protein